MAIRMDFRNLHLLMVYSSHALKRYKLSRASPMADRFRSQVREVINRNTVVSLALEEGFNAFLPVYDGGVDFVLYRERDGLVRKVQLKSRWTIESKYIGRDIWIAFPIGGDWYLMPHDQMLAHAKDDGVTQTASWIEGGSYSRPRPSAVLVAQCAPYRFASISVIANEATTEEPASTSSSP
jgi:hypothetical protein